MAKQFENNSEHKTSLITFIIGNGFDLGMGMKTSYSDIYEEYIKSPSNSPVISEFKKELSNRTAYDKWSDFEMGMAEYSKKLSSESELIECVRDFKDHMVQHLQAENQRIVDLIRDNAYGDIIVRELDRSLGEFHGGFSPNVMTQLHQFIKSPFAKYSIITFNYTKVIEELLFVKSRKHQISMPTPIHIHGSLSRDVVLGVDNIEQLDGVPYKISRKGKRAFLKTFFNEQYDTFRVSTAQKMISESSVICTYGFSMGESDKTWVNLLVDWLDKDSSHHLIVYQYDEIEYTYCNFDKLMDIEEAKKECLMRKMGITNDNIFNQIHIPVGYDIFNFKFEKIIPNTLPKSAYSILETI